VGKIAINFPEYSEDGPISITETCPAFQNDEIPDRSVGF
jgi:hypothetical protein